MEDGRRSQKKAKTLKFKKDEIEVLQDNIQIHYLGMGRENAQTNWSKDRKQLSVAQLTARLIEILNMYKGKPVPEEPKTTMQEQKQQPVVGTLISKVKHLETERTKKIKGFNVECRKEWKRRTESGEAATM